MYKYTHIYPKLGTHKSFGIKVLLSNRNFCQSLACRYAANLKRNSVFHIFLVYTLKSLMEDLIFSLFLRIVTF